jgi:ABC-type polysaccharide/polyol phosphate transport system ATPase subunit
MNSLTVEDLGKRYYLGRRARSQKARATIDLGPVSIPLPWGKKAELRELWALRHVSFTVRPGTILGVVGPNGAGKSTLLKILARVLRPTEGRVVGRGRVVSLLELGAGFNPDMSARENIFMNSAMHGIARHEVEERLDAIVEFAEIGEFLDSPMRHFSSGMYLRLAFSVAINMNPDILLADEILAVGDIEFQERCLQRVAEEGRKGLTVLFVSHDMAAIARLCHQALWLRQGQTVQLGDASTVVAEYQSEARQALLASATGTGEDRVRQANKFIELVAIRLVSSDGRVIGAAPISEDFFIRIRVRVIRPPVKLTAAIELYTKNVQVFSSGQPDPVAIDERGVYDIAVRIPANLLAETGYSVDVYLHQEAAKTQEIKIPDAVSFMTYGSSYTSMYKGGVLMPTLDWSVTSAVAETADVRG